MAKIKKRKLSWRASDSSQVVGYKLYWSEDGVPDYDSDCKMLGNVSEIILPDDVASFNPGSGPITFGITAVDELGNESDMATLAAPYQFSVPKAPDDLHMKSINDYYTSTFQRNRAAINMEVSRDSRVKSEKAAGRFNSGENSDVPDLSTNLKLIEKEALTF